MPRDRDRRTGSPCAARRHGFTLIELLVVVVITGILATALVIAVGSSGERRLERATTRFQALLDHACSTAELSGREVGVAVAADGYAFRRLDGDAWHDFGKDTELRARTWPNGLRIDLRRAGRALALATPQQDAPQVVCFSSGELTPFVLTLALGDAPVRYRLSGADDATIGVARIDVAR